MEEGENAPEEERREERLLAIDDECEADGADIQSEDADEANAEDEDEWADGVEEAATRLAD